MRALIFFIATVAASYAFADVAKDLERVDRAVRAVGHPAPPCANCEYGLAGTPAPRTATMSACLTGDCSANKGSMAVRACLIDVCGTDSPNIASAYAQIFASLASDQDYESKVLPLVRETISIRRKTDTEQLAAMEEWLKTKSVVTDPIVARLENFFRYAKLVGEVKYKAEDGKVVIDEEKSRAALANVPASEAEKVMTLSRHFLKLHSSGDNLSTDPSIIRLTPRAELRTQIESKLARLAADYREMKVNPELKVLSAIPNFDESFDPEIYRTRLSGSEVDVPAIIELNSNASSAKIFLSLVTNPEIIRIVDGPPVSAERLAADPVVKNGIAKSRARMAAPIEEVVAPKCQLALATANTIVPTRANINAFRPRIADLKSRFKKVISAFASGESLAKLSPVVDSWEASLPRSREAIREQILENLKKKLENEKSIARILPQMTKIGKRDTYIALLASTVGASSSSDESEAFEDLCKHLETSPVPDAAIAPYGTFAIGPMVVDHSPRFDGVSLHEMGHLLNLQLAKGELSSKTTSWYQTTKACMEGSRPNGTQFFGEDFADLLAAKDPSPNKACLYFDLKPESDLSALSLTNADATDPHSSELHRFLSIERIRKGKISSECSKALAEKGETMSSPVCGK